MYRREGERLAVISFLSNAVIVVKECKNIKPPDGSASQKCGREHGCRETGLLQRQKALKRNEGCKNEEGKCMHVCAV